MKKILIICLVFLAFGCGNNESETQKVLLKALNSQQQFVVDQTNSKLTNIIRDYQINPKRVKPIKIKTDSINYFQRKLVAYSYSRETKYSREINDNPLTKVEAVEFWNIYNKYLEYMLESISNINLQNEIKQDLKSINFYKSQRLTSKRLCVVLSKINRNSLKMISYLSKQYYITGGVWEVEKALATSMNIAVKRGEVHSSEVVLAVFNSSFITTTNINNQRFEKDYNKVLNIKTGNKLGNHKLEGTVGLLNNITGDTSKYSFNSNYQIIK